MTMRSTSTIHVAIVREPVARAILTGRKKVESRLSKRRTGPFQAIRAGDLIYFKRVGGEIFARATVGAVKMFHDLSARRVAALRREYNRLIAAPNSYWVRRARSRYAMLAWLEGVRPVTVRSRPPRQFGSGWLVIRRSHSRRSGL